MADFYTMLLSRWDAVVRSTIEHIQLSGISIFFAILLAVPIGVLLTRYRFLATPILGVTSVVQTIPSLALLAFMIPFFGIGELPAIVAMTVYALLPIMRNTYAGIDEVDKAVLEAGRGMGMTKRQILFEVELPLARSIIFAGIRTATVMTIGVATLAAFIGGGGLGDLIMRGLAMNEMSLVLAGAIPAAILAIVFDLFVALLDRLATPKALRLRTSK